MLARVHGLNALDIPCDSCDTLYAHNAINRTFGGHMPRVVCPSEQAQKTGCATVLYMRGPHQPYMPDRAGALGIFLCATSRLDGWPDFENVFVSQTKDFSVHRLHADDWIYAGRYELAESRFLDVNEIASLPKEVIALSTSGLLATDTTPDIRALGSPHKPQEQGRSCPHTRTRLSLRRRSIRRRYRGRYLPLHRRARRRCDHSRNPVVRYQRGAPGR